MTFLKIFITATPMEGMYKTTFAKCKFRNRNKDVLWFTSLRVTSENVNLVREGDRICRLHITWKTIIWLCDKAILGKLKNNLRFWILDEQSYIFKATFLPQLGLKVSVRLTREMWEIAFAFQFPTGTNLFPVLYNGNNSKFQASIHFH